MWNVFTAGYCETSFWVLLFDCSALLFLGARVEPVWGVRDYVYFMSAINLAVGTRRACWAHRPRQRTPPSRR